MRPRNRTGAAPAGGPAGRGLAARGWLLLALAAGAAGCGAGDGGEAPGPRPGSAGEPASGPPPASGAASVGPASGAPSVEPAPGVASDGESRRRGASPAAPDDSALIRLASELLPDLEERAGLPARRPPRLGRRERARLETFLEEELREKLPPERARALRRAYARLGLVPDTLDLPALLRRLYREQVVGYFDPEADTLFVLEEVSPRDARMVLVHELVHALQDQHVDLDSLTRSLRDDNDAANAARAAIEGQATFVMVEWALARAAGGQADLTRRPGLADLLQGAVSQAAPGRMPAFSAAPRIVRETLVFPYVSGLRFVQELWRRSDGRPAPFGKRLPASTEQVLHPEKGVGPGRDRPAEVAFGRAPPAGWSEVYAGELGELEARIFLEEHLSGSGESPADSAARRAAAGWDGDRLWLLEGPPGEALLWATVWDAPAEAGEFARAAERAVAARYGADPGEEPGRQVAVRRLRASGRPAVLVTDLPAGADPAAWRRAAAGLRASGGAPDGAAGGPRPGREDGRRAGGGARP